MEKTYFVIGTLAVSIAAMSLAGWRGGGTTTANYSGGRR